MPTPTNDLEKLGLLAAIPGFELALAALQEQLRQMKQDAGMMAAPHAAAAANHVSPKTTPTKTASPTPPPPPATATAKGRRAAANARDLRDPNWREKLSQTLKAKWEAMTPRERAAKSRALAAARRKKQALKKAA